MTEHKELQERVTQLVSQVILQTSGRSIAPAPEAPLFDHGPLDPFELPHLVLYLQDEFGVILEAHEVSPEALRSVAAITEILARRVTSEDPPAE